MRQTQIYGTHGQIECIDARHVTVFDFSTGERTVHDAPPGPMAPGHWGHGGADFHLIDSFVAAVATGDPDLISTNAADTLASHMLVFSAEEARRSGSVVTVGPVKESS